VPHPDATMQEERGQTVLRFERLLRHPPERVWEALTEAQELTAWHPTPYEFEREAGGAVRYSAGGNIPEMDDGEVTDWDPRGSSAIPGARTTCGGSSASMTRAAC
jgi:uncharacterized protein YndB with AHSA1/START domain